jgi:signal transduction histidine kinase
MKQVLLISRNPGFAPALEAAVGGGVFHWLTRVTAGEAEAEALVSSSACILAVEELNAETVRELEALAPHFRSGVLVHCRRLNEDWKEAACLAGAGQILKGSLRGSLLLRWLEQLSKAPEPPLAAPGAVPVAEPLRTMTNAAFASERGIAELFNLPAEPGRLVEEFLRVIRRTLAVNRMAVFSLPKTKSGAAAASLGHLGQPAYLPNISAESGLLREMISTGRVQSLNSADPAIRAELKQLGAQAAFPVPGQDSIRAIALVDGTVTGAALDESCFGLLFSLFEALGHSLEKADAHGVVSTDLHWQSRVLDRIAESSLVVNAARQLVHADAGARACLSLPEDAGFHDLPNVIGAQVFRALNGEAPEALLYQAGEAGRRYEVTFQALADGAGPCVLVLVGDITDVASSEQAAVAHSNRELIRSMAEHLAHEIGNSLVPLSTSQQLLAEGVTDTAGLESVMAESIRRIARMTAQMQFLSREGLRRIDEVPIGTLIEEAFGDASNHVPKLKPRLEFELELDQPAEDMIVTGEKAGLKHALAEVILNAMQAGKKNPRVIVRASRGELDGRACIDVDVSDFGEGLPAESLGQALQPFYSGRSVGLGLGLTAAKHVVDLHDGKLQIIQPADGQAACVRLRFPVERAD